MKCTPRECVLEHDYLVVPKNRAGSIAQLDCLPNPALHQVGEKSLTRCGSSCASVRCHIRMKGGWYTSGKCLQMGPFVGGARLCMATDRPTERAVLNDTDHARTGCGDS